jgi:chaperone modulatory protein CbpM
MSMKNEVIIVADYSEDETLTAADLCTICRIEIIELRNLVEFDILLPLAESQTEEEWQFDRQQLKRLRSALRLRRDLELNYQGVALVLQLMQEIEELRSINDVYQKHYLK